MFLDGVPDTSQNRAGMTSGHCRHCLSTQRLLNGEEMLSTRAPLTKWESWVLGFIFNWFLLVRDTRSIWTLVLLLLCSMERVSSCSTFIGLLNWARGTGRGDSPMSLLRIELRADGRGRVEKNVTLQLRETWFQFLLSLLWDLGQFVWPCVPQSPCLWTKTSVSFLGSLRTGWALYSSYFRVWLSQVDVQYCYPLIGGNTFQDPQWLPDARDRQQTLQIHFPEGIDVWFKI